MHQTSTRTSQVHTLAERERHRINPRGVSSVYCGYYLHGCQLAIRSVPGDAIGRRLGWGRISSVFTNTQQAHQRPLNAQRRNVSGANCCVIMRKKRLHQTSGFGLAAFGYPVGACLVKPHDATGRNDSQLPKSQQPILHFGNSTIHRPIDRTSHQQRANMSAAAVGLRLFHFSLSVATSSSSRRPTRPTFDAASQWPCMCVVLISGFPAHSLSPQLKTDSLFECGFDRISIGSDLPYPCARRLATGVPYSRLWQNGFLTRFSRYFLRLIGDADRYSHRIVAGKDFSH